MVVYILYVKADLEGIEKIEMKDGCDICISVRNPLDVNEVRQRIVIDLGSLIEPQVEEHERHRSENPHHIALKWNQGESKRATVRVLDRSSHKSNESTTTTKSKHNHDNYNDTIQKLRHVTSDDNGRNFVPFLAMECDGLEPYEFHPTGSEFRVTIQGGQILDGIDLVDGSDWTYYDLSTGSASITNLVSKFE
jgi:Eukaryotic protein of unknown function (DUF866)